ncbi:MAG: HAD-IB family hydrolase [Clostridiaceae bacterium]
MEKLAIFDVDFTITGKETLMELFRFLIKKDLKNIRFVPRAIFGGIMYLMKFYDEKMVKEKFLKFLDGVHEKDLALIVKEFYRDNLTNILYKDAIDMIRKLKSEGYLIYLISASPEFYLNEFYNIKEVDKIIGTKFYINEGRFVTRMEGANCKGEEKVRRLKEELKKEGIRVDFKNSYMFSDSLADKPLLDLVGRPYLINYKKGHKDFEILKWK